MFDDLVTIDDMIHEIRREIEMRRGAYPKWIKLGRLNPDQAARRILILERVQHHLENIKKAAKQ